MNKKKLLSGVLFFLIIIEILISAFLIFQPSNASVFCATGSSCGDVQSSSYGYILGIKLSYIGLFSFIALLSLFILSSKKEIFRFWYLLACLLGAFLAAYLIFIQLFVLNQICSNCLIIDSIIILIFIISIMGPKR